MKSFDLVLVSYVWLWNNKPEVGKIALPVLFLIFTTQFINNELLLIFIYLIGVWLVSSSMIQLHRFILLEKDKSSIKILAQPSRLDFIYLFVWFLLTIIENIFERVIDQISGYSGPFEILIIILSIILSIYVFGRSYMIFPAVSVGKDFSFAWKLTNKKGRVLLTIASLFIFLIPMFLFLAFMLMLVGPNLYLILASIFLNMVFVNAHYSHLFKSFTVRRDK